MSTGTTETTDREDTEPSTTAETFGTPDAGASSLPGLAVEQVKNGRLPILVGAVLTARSVRDLLSRRGRGLARAATGLVLLGFGLRRRSTAADAERGPGEDVGTDRAVPGRETVARRAESNEPDHNPRDVDEGTADATATESGSGDVAFETDEDDADVERKPHLDDGDPNDPRYPDEGDPETDDEGVDVDLSESAMADETSEAAGPDEEQAYPSREGTDPEPSGTGSPQRTGETVGEERSAAEGADGEETTGEEPDEETAAEGTGDDGDDAEVTDEE